MMTPEMNEMLKYYAEASLTKEDFEGRINEFFDGKAVYSVQYQLTEEDSSSRKEISAEIVLGKKEKPLKFVYSDVKPHIPASELSIFELDSKRWLRMMEDFQHHMEMANTILKSAMVLNAPIYQIEKKYRVNRNQYKAKTS